MAAQKKKEVVIEAEKTWLERSAESATKGLGSTASLAVHTVLFLIAASLPFFGIPLGGVLLVVTTLVSLEAIYMSIFIQMSVNKNTADIEEIQEDVDEIQEDIEEIGEDVDEIQKDVDEIQEDVEGIEKDIDEIQEDIEEDEEEEAAEATQQQKEYEALASIQSILTNLQKEIEHLKKK